jgi:biotin carboxyl carrier protein
MKRIAFGVVPFVVVVVVACGGETNPARTTAEKPSPPEAAQSTATSSPAPASPAATEPSEAAKEAFYCPMHPEVTSEGPGTCPKCNMALVKEGD